MRFCLFLLLLVFCVSTKVLAQSECTGNFGANIFEAGDFGRGDENVVQEDPGFAPGYTYTRFPPPSDGFYTLTNGTGEWSLFAGWMPIINSSSDEKGYMMVVNASFEPGIFYEQQIDGLCENTTYRFSADIINLIDPNYDELIKPRVSFLINDEVMYDTGEIPQNANWNIYGFNVATSPGQTSLKLSLRNNAPGGIGNDLALDNIFFRPCGPEALILPRAPANICEDGEPIPLFATINGDEFPDPAVQWQQSFDEGDSWEDIPGARDSSIVHTDLRAGDYYYRYYVANSESSLTNEKCRVISNVKIVRVLPKEYVVRDTFCAGTTYMFGDNVLDEPGFYIDSLLSSIGCDSIVFLTLAEVPVGEIEVDWTVTDASCFGRSDGAVEVRIGRVDYPPTNIFLQNRSVRTNLALFNNLPADSFGLEVVDRFGCRFAADLVVNEPMALTLNVGPDRQLMLGDPLVIYPEVNQPFSELRWDGGLSGSCNDLSCFPLELLPISDTTILWKVTSSPGCEVFDTLRVTVDASRNLFVPNAFSPNFDGRNDYFGVYGREGEIREISVLRVFDRWGGLVYEGEKLPVNVPESGWDGTANGMNMPKGVYTYQLQVIFLDGVVRQLSGSVMLLY